MSNQAMTNDKQVEVWRKEFEQGYSGDKDCFVRHPAFTNTYWFEKVQLHWEGFLMAKRSLPQIELPTQINCEGVYFDLDGYSADGIHAAITAAGYSYRVKS